MTEDEMAAHFRNLDVRVILDFGFDKALPVAEAAELHDYGFEMQRRHPDVILGHWVQIDPRSGARGVQELRRCRDVAPGFLGFAVSGSGAGPASDAIWDPYYKLCIEAHVPVLIFIGTTDLGASLPGGGGVLVENCHPRYLDQVAARYPELVIMAGRPGWPWESEAVAVLLHKQNIWHELHGRSPKYFTPDLKGEIPRRLKHRVMFGGDYPLYSYADIIRDWNGEAYSDDVLEHVFTRNAERFLASFCPLSPSDSFSRPTASR
jgi:predicted TIM-barrel fold metal-dependent hydrolase